MHLIYFYVVHLLFACISNRCKIKHLTIGQQSTVSYKNQMSESVRGWGLCKKRQLVVFAVSEQAAKKALTRRTRFCPMRLTGIYMEMGTGVTFWASCEQAWTERRKKHAHLTPSSDSQPPLLILGWEMWMLPFPPLPIYAPGTH